MPASLGSDAARRVSEIAKDTAQARCGADPRLSPFLEQHQLLRPGPAQLARLQAKSQERTWSSWRWWLHHYLFFRIPLLHPQARLQRLAQALDWLFHPLTAAR
jgi:putative peptide zinc metalloprotease protein